MFSLLFKSKLSKVLAADAKNGIVIESNLVASRRIRIYFSSIRETYLLLYRPKFLKLKNTFVKHIAVLAIFEWKKQQQLKKCANHNSSTVNIALTCLFTFGAMICLHDVNCHYFFINAFLLFIE